MKIIVGICAAAMLSGCVIDDLAGFGPGRAERDAIFAARSGDELIALGGTRLLEEDIIVALAGQTMVEPNEAWTWTIGEDNTHHASADNGDWADPAGGIWQIVGDQFCRENEVLALKCSDVYQVGPYFKFTETDGSLAVWTVTQG